MLTEFKCKKEGDNKRYEATKGRCVKDDGKTYIPLYGGSIWFPL